MPRTNRARSTADRRRATVTVEPLEGRALLSHAAHRPPPRPSPQVQTRPPAAPAPAASWPAAGPVAYTPAQVRHAYGFDRLGLDGAGQVIAIIDAGDDPTIGADLQTFDRTFGLPDPPFYRATPRSGPPAYDRGWALETALDVEWAHAVAPKAAIVLVEAATNAPADLLAAVDYAVGLGVRVVSMSWGGPAYPGVSALDGHFNRPGVTFTAAAGDSGAGVNWPAASPFVTAVGGTTLTLDPYGNRLAETAWSGGGGGTTTAEPRPWYQPAAFTGGARGVPDVSYLADPNTGLLVYDSSSGTGWFRYGGTSAGAPQWAGLFALANQGRTALGKAPLGQSANALLYKLAGGSRYTNPNGDFLDVTRGGNGTPATAGWDRATGLGSPVADRLVLDLMRA